MDTMEAARFLQTLHGTTEDIIELGTLEPGRGGILRAYHYTPEQLQEQAVSLLEAEGGTKHIYVTAAPLAQLPPKGKRGSRAHVKHVSYLHADLEMYSPDTHSKTNLPRTVEEAKSLLQGLPEPSKIIHTGNGLLVLWRLSEPEKNLRYAAKLLEGVQAHIRRNARAKGWHVDKTDDLARLIRVPGSLNHKTNPAKPVVTLEGSGKQYSPHDFAWCILPEQPKQPVKARGSMSRERAQELLNHIPKQQAYEDWLRVIAALKHELGSETALELAEAWSPGYEGEIADKLETLREDHDRPATGGTLYYLAEQNGWESKAEKLLSNHRGQ